MPGCCRTVVVELGFVCERLPHRVLLTPSLALRSQSLESLFKVKLLCSGIATKRVLHRVGCPWACDILHDFCRN